MRTNQPVCSVDHTFVLGEMLGTLGCNSSILKSFFKRDSVGNVVSQSIVIVIAVIVGRKAATPKVQNSTATVHSSHQHAVRTVRMPFNPPNSATQRFGAKEGPLFVHVSGIKQANGFVVFNERTKETQKKKLNITEVTRVSSKLCKTK